MACRTSDFDYRLAERLIAQDPPDQRGTCRLLTLNRTAGELGDHTFDCLAGLLRPGDLLVLNNTRVIAARFFCRRATGGRVEGLFLAEHTRPRWEVLLRNAQRCRPGEVLQIENADPPASLRLEEACEGGRWTATVDPDQPAVDLLDRAGITPLPPYIHRQCPTGDSRDRHHYQTVYARQPGAVAAPTAGLHFTDEMLTALAAAGIATTFVTLHVGLGTFAPVKAENLSEHPMHSEWYHLPATAAEAVNTARAQGRRVVAVGTTAVRVLETATAVNPDGPIEAADGWTDIFLYPPATFRAVDALITNFHLPRSTLLMLVAAFCDPGGTRGLKMILDAYAHAIAQDYRFYSYGDAMLIE